MSTIELFTTQQKASHNSHKFAFTLSPTNHGYWKRMLEPFLITNNLFGYIDGSITCPTPTITTTSPATTAQPSTTTVTTNPNYTTWKHNDAHVQSVIISTVSEAAFSHVQGDTARDLWLSLEHAFAPNTASREYTLKLQLLKLQMKGDETPLNYLGRVQDYATALANIGQPVTDKDLVLYSIAGLREEYNNLKTTILGRSSPLSFSELHGLLCDHDYMINKPLETASPAAFTTTFNQSLPPIQALQQLASQLGFQMTPTNQPVQSPQAFYSTRPNQFRPNYNRGRRGASRGNQNFSTRGRGRSDYRPNFSWASTQNTVHGFCNRCGIGHLPNDCPHRDPSGSRQNASANYANARPNHSDQRSTSGSTWYPDTGANSHVTPDLSNLDYSEPYYGNDSLHIGDGKGLPIFHIGSTKFYSPNKTLSISNTLHVPSIRKNLLSVQQFCFDNNVYFEFHSSYFVVKDESTHTTLLTGPSDQGLYTLRLPHLQSIHKTSFSATRTSSDVWHQ
ncbi:hypothetical protein QVD17_02111 [Tagetes erecta]|uniref:Retrovirus-related Pol polyprotein from transposon TNT 1-94-like beta-barrel domain-containing protein n=1 Tax=Tagetes erecta TaxID=13708 RepID=A0AAD8LDC6_TARER|nr:hypothetical protein QVD17_02111 [Tagetes erecta]